MLGSHAQAAPPLGCSALHSRPWASACASPYTTTACRPTTHQGSHAPSARSAVFRAAAETAAGAQRAQQERGVQPGPRPLRDAQDTQGGVVGGWVAKALRRMGGGWVANTLLQKNAAAVYQHGPTGLAGWPLDDMCGHSCMPPPTRSLQARCGGWRLTPRCGRRRRTSAPGGGGRRLPARRPARFTSTRTICGELDR